MFPGFHWLSFLLGLLIGAWLALGYAIRRYKHHHNLGARNDG